MSTFIALHVETKGQIIQCTSVTTRPDQLRSRRHRVNMSTRSAEIERTSKVYRTLCGYDIVKVAIHHIQHAH